MALAVRTFSQMVYIGGVPAMRIYLVYFLKFQLCFWTIVWGITGAIVDVIGFLMSLQVLYLGTLSPLLCLVY